MAIGVDELRSRYVGMVFDSVEVQALRDEMVGFASACGETEPCYIDPDHEDFQAPVNFTTKYHGARMLPDDFPEFDRRAMIDAGKAITWHRPIRAGETLTARSQIYDIYEKTGRSGVMLFLVHRMEFTNEGGELTSVVDWRLILRGGLS
ncbi:MaoC family dehydratase N-terminal domain-containing protein [Myxococcota bacterium]|nr:MaoC family dehydratase N-terminal domain-containing protein [Myxococcota bacterium]